MTEYEFETITTFSQSDASVPSDVNVIYLCFWNTKTIRSLNCIYEKHVQRLS